jgi:hypothetical protein
LAIFAKPIREMTLPFAVELAIKIDFETIKIFAKDGQYHYRGNSRNDIYINATETKATRYESESKGM